MGNEGGTDGQDPAAKQPRAATDPFGKVQPVERMSSMPHMREVPETREEVVRRRIMRIVTAIVLVLITAISVWAVRAWMRTKGIEKAVAVYEETGTKESLKAALERLDNPRGDSEQALRARVLASASYEVGDSSKVDAETSLRDVGDEVDAQIAETYLALVDGQPTEAAAAASALVPQGSRAAEIRHVRALSAVALGNLELAQQEADAAHALEPSSPRHAALRALVLARSGHADAGRQLLASYLAGSSLARIAAARTYALEYRWRDAREAVKGDTDTEVQDAWATLLTARAVVEVDGQEGSARVLVLPLVKKVGASMAADEPFALTLADTLVAVGSAKEAREQVLAKLPAGASTDATWRAQIAFHAAVVAGDLKAADALAPKIGDTNYAKLLAAQWHEAHDRSAEARNSYEAVLKDARLGRAAAIRLANMELSLGRAKAAFEVIEPLLTAEPTEPRIAVVAALALGRSEQADRAQAVLAKAMAARPEDVSLWRAKAQVEMGTEAWEAALQSLGQALKRSQTDPDVLAMAGDASRALNRADQARKYYEQALALGDSHPDALVGLLSLAVEARDVETAKRSFDKINEIGVATLEADVARSQYWVLASMGREGGREVQKIMDAHRGGRKDAELWMARAMLYYQAEEHGPAARAFGMAASFDRARVEPQVLRLFPQVELRLKGPSKHTVEVAEKLDTETQLTTRQKALVRAAGARYEFFMDHVAMAQRRAEQALALDPDQAEALLVMADLLLLRSRNALDPLRKAAKAPAAPPRAWAELAIALGQGKEACEYAKRYRQSAPSGVLNPQLRPVLQTCE